MTWGDYLSYAARAKAAEAERDALWEALEKIAEADEHGSVWMQDVARAALERSKC